MTRSRKGVAIRVLHTARVRVWQDATIPMPEPVYRLETAVSVAGRQYTVSSDEQGGDMRIYPTSLPRRRAMRRCPRRDAILAAVARALPALRELDTMRQRLRQITP